MSLSPHSAQLEDCLAAIRQAEPGLHFRSAALNDGGQKSVIVFGAAGLGDPAYDYAGLLSSYGEPFLARCAAHDPDLEALLPHARFHRATFALLEAFHGLEHDDPRALRAGLATYV